VFVCNHKNVIEMFNLKSLSLENVFYKFGIFRRFLQYAADDHLNVNHSCGSLLCKTINDYQNLNIVSTSRCRYKSVHYSRFFCVLTPKIRFRLVDKIYDLIWVKFIIQGNVRVQCIIPAWFILERGQTYTLMCFSKRTIVQRLVHDKNINLINF
jgi:hypothetical protein